MSTKDLKPDVSTAVKLQSDSDEVDRIMLNIHTGEDAINFFARYGSDTPLKFVNLFQLKDSKDFRPYDLVVGFLKDNQFIEHFTMSPSGIVHVIPGFSSECISLANWTRQSMNFRILRKIPFYKYYLHRKAFQAWRSNVRFALFARQRKKVTDRLFLARNSMCRSIISVKRKLVEVKNVKLVTIDVKTCEKDYFIEQQTSYIIKMGQTFEDILRDIVREVQQVLTSIQDIHGSVIKDNPNEKFAEAFIDEVKAKSLVQLREEKVQKKLQKQRAKFELGSLSDFIRYVDYLVVETFVTLIIKTIQSFYEELMKSRKAGIFEATVRFNR